MPGLFDPRIRTKSSKSGTRTPFGGRIAESACRRAESQVRASVRVPDAVPFDSRNLDFRISCSVIRTP